MCIRDRSYLGIGAGAHSFLSSESSHGKRWKNQLAPAKYIAEVQKLGTAAFQEETIDSEQARLEYLFLGLRTTTGVDLEDYRKRFSESEIDPAIEEMQKGDLISLEGSSLRLTEKGFLFSDTVFGSF